MLSAGFILLAIIVFTNVTILLHINKIIPMEEASAPVALILGGGMKENGEQSEMQRDRVLTGIELYKAGRVQTLVMTGDDGTRRFNEVDAMKQLAVDNGVPEEDIIIDPKSFRTYLSCYRAKHVYGFDQVIGVSQNFHLPRILYFCNSMGIDTVGVSADKSDYGWNIYRMHLRDVLARVKGWWQMEVSRPVK